MKILNTDNSQSELLKKKNKTDDFRKTLEKNLNDENDELEEFRVLLPQHGHYWDNGYQDIDKEVL